MKTKKTKFKKIEFNKVLENEPNGFTNLKIEVNDNFVALTFINKEYDAISFQKNLNENGFVLHVIPGYLDKEGKFVSEGKLETTEPLDVSKIVSYFMGELKIIEYQRNMVLSEMEENSA